MAASTAELKAIENRVSKDAGSLKVAYVLWIFLGLASAHRFYLRRPTSAVLQIMSYFFLIGFIWLILDGLFIPTILQNVRDDLRQQEWDALLNHRS